MSVFNLQVQILRRKGVSEAAARVIALLHFGGSSQ